MKITREHAKHYGKYAAATVVGVGVGLTGYAANDTPTQQTDTYQNLQEKLNAVESENTDLESEVAKLETTVQGEKAKVANLQAQVEQFHQTVQELRDENADLEDAVAQAQERVGLVDYLPVFSDEDVEFEDNGLDVAVDQEADEGDYDRVTANYISDDGNYDVTVTQYEESKDAEDRVTEFYEANNPVEFTADGDTHTVEVSGGFTGQLDFIDFNYDDEMEDVDHEDDVESVYVGGEDVTDKVESVEHYNNKETVRINFEGNYYVNERESIEVSYSDVSDAELESVDVNNAETYEYDQDDDSREDVYRDGNTVVEVQGTDNGDEFEAQYEDLQSNYE